jgi:hypothetical protein
MPTTISFINRTPYDVTFTLDVPRGKDIIAERVKPNSPSTALVLKFSAETLARDLSKINGLKIKVHKKGFDKTEEVYQQIEFFRKRTKSRIASVVYELTSDYALNVLVRHDP